MTSRQHTISSPHSPSRDVQRWHYECIVAELGLLRHENRYLKEVMGSWEEIRNTVLPQLEHVRLAIASLSSGADILVSPSDSNKSVCSPGVADNLYRMHEPE